jgi:23S rRNA (uridine2479-2'-O)-methyltransferase
VLRVTSRNARFQQFQALLGNRGKRQRNREFLVQGVRPITLAAEFGWPFRALLYDAERPLSAWARTMLRDVPALQVAMSPALLAELGEKEAAPPELVAVVEMPEDDLDRIPAGPGFLGVVLDRPASPGNIGSIIRSADAFGADGIIVTGHAADIYDPRAVRASTGSLFARPVVRVPSPREVAAWVSAQRARGCPIVLAGTDEHGDVDVFDADLTRPVLLLVGTESTGLSTAWRDLCDLTVRIPITGAASSLNAANAATVVLYEITRQRLLAARSLSASLALPGGSRRGLRRWRALAGGCPRGGNRGYAADQGAETGCQGPERRDRDPHREVGPAGHGGWRGCRRRGRRRRASGGRRGRDRGRWRWRRRCMAARRGHEGQDER